MRAATFTEYGEPLTITEIDAPDPDPAGVVVETEACGICRSDWHAWVGDWEWRGVKPDPGHVFGHEPAGRVVAVGSEVERVREGDHVAIPFNLGDGSCSLCRNGHSNICENRMGLGFTEEAPGAWAEEVHVPHADHNIVHLPDGVSSVDMAGLGCRYMTSFHALAHRADVNAGDWLAIHGCGGIGLSAVQIGSTLGANVIAVDLKEPKLRKAETLGAVETVNAADVEDVPKEIKAITDGGADIAVDALGIETTCRNAVSCLAKRGQHVQIGMTTKRESGEITLPTDTMVLNEIEFIGSLGMQPTRYDEIFRLVDSGRLDPAAVVSETVPLEATSEKLDAMTDFETEGIPVIDEF
ncbi:MAG: zinc-dependent alcohol dehydrogenase family protein [Halobacteriales archaeon]|nr:zinc-dependent alcohol dehydrogenase family protein [Halobacteriales archaeon]